eukprot:g7543.t1
MMAAVGGVNVINGDEKWKLKALGGNGGNGGTYCVPNVRWLSRENSPLSLTKGRLMNHYKLWSWKTDNVENLDDNDEQFGSKTWDWEELSFKKMEEERKKVIAESLKDIEKCKSRAAKSVQRSLVKKLIENTNITEEMTADDVLKTNNASVPAQIRSSITKKLSKIRKKRKNTIETNTIKLSKRRKKKRKISNNVHRVVRPAAVEYGDDYVKRLEEEALEKLLLKRRQEICRLRGLGITKLESIVKTENHTVGPMHAGASIVERVYKAFFLLARMLEPYTDSTKLGPVSKGFIMNVTGMNSDFQSLGKWYIENSPKITKNLETGDNANKGVMEAPRLGGDAAKYILKHPNVLAIALLKSLSIFRFGVANRTIEVANTTFTVADWEILANLIMYINLLSTELQCLTVRLIPPPVCTTKLSGKVWYKGVEYDSGIEAVRFHQKLLRENQHLLNYVSDSIITVENYFLRGLTCNYTLKLHILGRRYNEHYMDKYTCSSGVVSNEQSTERANSVIKQTQHVNRSVGQYVTIGPKYCRKTNESAVKKKNGKTVVNYEINERTKEKVVNMQRERKKLDSSLEQILKKINFKTYEGEELAPTNAVKTDEIVYKCEGKDDGKVVKSIYDIVSTNVRYAIGIDEDENSAGEMLSCTEAGTFIELANLQHLLRASAQSRFAIAPKTEGPYVKLIKSNRKRKRNTNVTSFEWDKEKIVEKLRDIAERAKLYET